jgi:hypothetical protein
VPDSTTLDRENPAAWCVPAPPLVGKEILGKLAKGEDGDNSELVFVTSHSSNRFIRESIFRLDASAVLPSNERTGTSISWIIESGKAYFQTAHARGISLNPAVAKRSGGFHAAEPLGEFQ